VSTEAATEPDERRLLDPSLFVRVDDAAAPWRLVGSRCGTCGAVTFPAQASCPRCTGGDVSTHALADRGTVWASTVQRFSPKTPYLGADGSLRPFGVGYVDLAGEVIVETRLVGDPADLGIGAPVSLTFEALPGRDGEPVWTFAFAPTEPDRIVHQ
jgi:uncharacterized OB-fold protein